MHKRMLGKGSEALRLAMKNPAVITSMVGRDCSQPFMTISRVTKIIYASTIHLHGRLANVQRSKRMAVIQ